MGRGCTVTETQQLRQTWSNLRIQRTKIFAVLARLNLPLETPNSKTELQGRSYFIFWKKKQKNLKIDWRYQCIVAGFLQNAIICALFKNHAWCGMEGTEVTGSHGGRGRQLLCWSYQPNQPWQSVRWQMPQPDHPHIQEKEKGKWSRLNFANSENQRTASIFSGEYLTDY